MPPPSEFAIALVLGAAMLHALWNAVVKGSPDRAITIGLIAVGNALFGMVLALFVEPPARESWVYIALTILVHLFYFLGLISAYRLGDFSRVYPIARGIAPLLVAMASMVFANEYLSIHSWFGIGIISFAMGLLVFTRPLPPVQARAGSTTALPIGASSKAVVAALLTGVCIASYTIVDGLGVRAAGSELGYIGWSFGLQIVLGLGFLFYRRAHLKALTRGQYFAGIIGGLISGIAYALAIYAMSLTSLGAVSAIRESSVIIGALIGVIWFGERPWLNRVGAAGLVALGVFLLSNG